MRAMIQISKHWSCIGIFFMCGNQTKDHQPLILRFRLDELTNQINKWLTLCNDIIIIHNWSPILSLLIFILWNQTKRNEMKVSADSLHSKFIYYNSLLNEHGIFTCATRFISIYSKQDSLMLLCAFCEIGSLNKPCVCINNYDLRCISTVIVWGCWWSRCVHGTRVRLQYIIYYWIISLFLFVWMWGSSHLHSRARVSRASKELCCNVIMFYWPCNLVVCTK